jgi:pimeloyl-ACP methyl ester carboxylesterase
MIDLPLPPGVERETLTISHGQVQAIHAPPHPDDDTGVKALLVSGFFGTKEDFREVLPLLARAGYHGWAYDYPGQIDSDDAAGGAGPEDFTIGQFAADLTEIIRAVSGDEPVHVVGHCLGGFITRATVLADPSLARSLALVSCGPDMREPRHKTMLAGLAKLAGAEMSRVLWPLVKRLLAEDDKVMREFWRTKLARMNPHFTTGAARLMGDETDRCAELAATGMPILVVHGKRDRRLWRPDTYARMAQRLDADYIVINDASHSPNMETPGQTATALLDFWAPAQVVVAR